MRGLLLSAREIEDCLQNDKRMSKGKSAPVISFKERNLHRHRNRLFESCTEDAHSYLLKQPTSPEYHQIDKNRGDNDFFSQHSDSQTNRIRRSDSCQCRSPTCPSLAEREASVNPKYCLGDGALHQAPWCHAE